MKIIIFDLDGTLADTLPSITAALNETLVHYGYNKIEMATIKPVLGTGARKLLEASIPTQDHFKIDDILEYYTPILVKHSQTAKPFPKIDQLLQKLKNNKNIITAVCSNKPQEAAIQFICSTGLLVSEVVGVCQNMRPKPEVDMVEVLRQKYHTDQIIIVGDTEVDFQTAQNAGIQSILVSYGFRPKQELTQLSHRVVDSVDELDAELEKFLLE